MAGCFRRAVRPRRRALSPARTCDGPETRHEGSRAPVPLAAGSIRFAFQLEACRNTLQYEKEFAPGMHFLAQVSLESDGVLYHYEFVNHSDVDFDSVQAITDPRMISPLFHDVRLERTYVHGPQGFVLLASTCPNASRCRSTNGFPIATASPTRGLSKKLVCRSRQTGLRFLMLPIGLMNRSWRRSQRPPLDYGDFLSEPRKLMDESRPYVPACRPGDRSSAPQQRDYRGEDVALPGNA